MFDRTIDLICIIYTHPGIVYVIAQLSQHCTLHTANIEKLSTKSLVDTGLPGSCGTLLLKFLVKNYYMY